MSLDFDLRKIDREKYPNIKWGENRETYNPITHACIWATMAVGIGQPEKDPEEWVRRNLMYNHMLGHLKGLGPDDSDLSTEELTVALWDHRGLHTNVQNLTRPQWFKQMRRVMEAQMDRFPIPAELLEEAR